MKEPLVRLEEIECSVETIGDFLYPNWEAISAWINERIPEPSVNNAWLSIARQWLQNLISQMPNGYRLEESEEFLMITCEDEVTSQRILNWCESYRYQIMNTLVNVAADEGYGKHVVIAFSNLERYYDYIDPFFEGEGEFGGSGGIFLDRGYGHIALPSIDWWTERTLVHELTHCLIRHLPLPGWINEGVTQVMEDLILGSSNFQLDAELAGRHKTYWGMLGIRVKSGHKRFMQRGEAAVIEVVAGMFPYRGRIYRTA